MGVFKINKSEWWFYLIIAIIICWVLFIVYEIVFALGWYSAIFIFVAILFIFYYLRNTRDSHKVLLNKLWLEFEAAKKNYDEKKRQEIRLLIEWNSISKKAEIENVPDRWDFDNNFISFASNIVEEYRGTVFSSPYKSFKPDCILPFPKKQIIKSFLYLIDCKKRDGENFTALYTEYLFLSTMFLDIEKQKISFNPSPEEIHDILAQYGKEREQIKLDEKVLRSWGKP